MGLRQERWFPRDAGVVEVESGLDVVLEDRSVVADETQVDHVGSPGQEDRQNIQEVVVRKVESLGQGRKHREGVHSLDQTDPGGSNHQTEVEVQNLGERKGRHVEVLMEADLVERHSNERAGSAGAQEQFMDKSFFEEGIQSEGRQRKFPHGFAH